MNLFRNTALMNGLFVALNRWGSLLERSRRSAHLVMHKCFWYTFFLVCSVLGTSLAQEREFPATEVTLQWTALEQQRQQGVLPQRLHFDRCEYRPDQAVPFYYTVLHGAGSTRLRVRPLSTRLLREDEVRLLKGTELSADFQWKSHPLPGAGPNAVSLELIPIRKVAAAQYECLERFELLAGEPILTDRSVQVSKNTRAYGPAQSVLSQGKWVKLSISKTGVYQLTYSQLRKWGFSRPEQVSVWGNGYAPLPIALADTVSSDLKQYPTLISENQRVLFYAQAKETWTWNANLNLFLHQRNEFDQQAYIYLTDAYAPKRIARNADELPQDVLEQETDAYTYRDYLERYDTCLIASGRRWFGESFDLYPSRTYRFTVPAAVPNAQTKCRAVFGVRSGSASSVRAYNGGDVLNQGSVEGVNLDSKMGDFAREAVLDFTLPVQTEEIDFVLNYQKPVGSVNAKAWLDYVVMNTRAKLQLPSGGQLLFRDPLTVLDRAVTDFTLTRIGSGGLAFDVTDPFEVKQMDLLFTGTQALMRARTDRLREFAVLVPSGALVPTFVEYMKNQNLHAFAAADYVIVTHPSFQAQADELAQWHTGASGLRTAVVSTEQVYNEFSAGIPDPTAIRNFLYHLKQQGRLPESVLLFGDGSYVNLKGKPGASLVPTFQSLSSLNQGSSYMSDDYFVCLEQGENMDANQGIPQYGLSTAIGRFPVNTTEQARLMVRKVKDYMRAPQTDWIGRWVFIADDKDANEHMAQANEMADSVVASAPYYRVNKLFLDAYPKYISPSGERYPKATEAINQVFNEGHLVSCYVGHANEYWIAEEKVVTMSDIQSWTNGVKMPLFITATCEFARFDTRNGMSAGEAVLLHRQGGSVALLSTTRLVYSHLNFSLTKRLYQELLVRDAQGVPLRLGEAVRQAKNNSFTGINQLCFALLGDPALRLHTPKQSLSLDSINARPVLSFSDTLKALGKFRISGSLPAAGKEVSLSVYDKKQSYSTLGNAGEPPFVYRDRKSRLVHARLEGSDARFRGQFLLPKDLLPEIGSGLMTYWAYSESGASGEGESSVAALAGAFDGFLLGGLDASQVDKDHTGPLIQLYLNDESFVPGGVVGAQAKCVAILSDSSGINISGNGIGRNLQLHLLPEDLTYVLNDAYITDKSNPYKGSVRFDLPKLSPGVHSLTLKAWDNYNNASEKSIAFQVSEQEKLSLFHVLNYPNPFTEKTAFYFEHNGGEQSMQYLIQIYTVSGKLVKTFRGMVTGAARQGPIEWDGRDDFGHPMGRGVYFYKVKVSCMGGERAEKIQKLVILK